jgi:hypothetical protein
MRPVTRRLLAVSICLSGSGQWSGVADAGEREALEAPLYAATVIYVADRLKCTVKDPCCFSVGGQVPSAELAKLLKGQRRLNPVAAVGACGGWTIDVDRVPPYGSDEQHVASGVGGEGFPFFFCNHVLTLTPQGWTVDPKRDMCPVT